MALRIPPVRHVPAAHELRQVRDAAQTLANWCELAGMDFEAKVARETRDRATCQLLLLVQPEPEDGE